MVAAAIVVEAAAIVVEAAAIMVAAVDKNFLVAEKSDAVKLVLVDELLE